MDSQGEKGWAPADYFQPVVGPDDALPAADLVFDDDEDDGKDINCLLAQTQIATSLFTPRIPKQELK